MAYRKYNNYKSSQSEDSTPPVATIDLGKNKKLSVRQFKGINLVDIREFYQDANGEDKPGKKGISLTEDIWDALLKNQSAVNNALRMLGSKSKRDESHDEPPRKKRATELPSSLPPKPEIDASVELNKAMRKEQKQPVDSDEEFARDLEAAVAAESEEE